MSDVEAARLFGSSTERAVLDALPSAVVITDRNGGILSWNAAAETLSGRPEREVLGRSIVDVLAPVDHDDAGEQDLEQVRAGQTIAVDRLVVRSDGAVRRARTNARPMLDESGEVVAIVATFYDVTDLRDREQATRDLNQHFQLALEAGGLGTWRWDMRSGTTEWDEQLEAVFGLAPGGFDGTFEAYVALLHPDDRELVLRTVEDAVSTRTPYRVEHRVVLPDGTVRWIAGAGAVTIGEHGEATGTVGCAADVTDRIEAELEGRRVAAIAAAAAEQERTQRQRLEFLNGINDAINGATTVEEIVTNVTRAAVPRLGDWCAIHLLGDDHDPAPTIVEIAHVDPRMVAYAHDLMERFPYDPDAPAGVGAAIRTGQTQFLPEITDDVLDQLELPDELREIVDELALRSSIATPLRRGDRTLGAVQFVMSKSSRTYTADDVSLAEAVAGRLASSVENLALHEQQRMIAHTLQQSLLPASLPDVPGVDVAVRYWAAGKANEVGGDFYDVFSLEEPGRWAAVIGDVCGTGAGAAALTGLARHSIRSSAWHGDDPERVLDVLNRAVARSGSETFLTCAYAVLDVADGARTLTVACAGHPPPIHVGAAGATPLGVHGRLLGMFDDVEVTSVTRSLAAGDVVVFYTDGITDLPPPHALDEVAVLDLMQRAVEPGGSAEAIADRIRDAVTDVLSFRERNDDIALLVLRVADDR